MGIHVASYYKVCVLANKIVPSVDNSMLNYPYSVIIDKGIYNIGIS